MIRQNITLICLALIWQACATTSETIDAPVELTNAKAAYEKLSDLGGKRHFPKTYADLSQRLDQADSSFNTYRESRNSQQLKQIVKSARRIESDAESVVRMVRNLRAWDNDLRALERALFDLNPQK